MAKELPQTVKDYSEANPLASAGHMRGFQSGRNAGVEEAAALVEKTMGYSETELAAKIRALFFTND